MTPSDATAITYRDIAYAKKAQLNLPAALHGQGPDTTFTNPYRRTIPEQGRSHGQCQ
jgi:hypothetical protein